MAKANLGELLIKIGVDTKKLDAGLNNASAGLKKFGLTSNKVAVGVTAAFAGMTLAVGAFGKATTEVGAGFEQSMATVGAVAGSTQGQLMLMEQRAREVGRSTLFTARQSADAMVEFARAGFKAGEIIAATEPAINLAGATAANLTSAVKGVSAALKVFQLDASQAARVADVFAVATQNSLFDLQGLIDAMKYGGPASAAFDLTIEQATAYMMVLRNLGLEASQAGVYLRQILTSAANLTPKAAGIFEAVGISAEQLNPRVNHLDDIIKTLGDSADLTAESIQDAFGKRGGPIVAALVNQYRRLGDEGLQFLEFQEKLEASAGKAEEMYRRQIDTVIGQFTIARSAMEDLFIAMFFGFSGELKNLGIAFAGMFNSIREAIRTTGFAGLSEPIARFAQIINQEKGNIAQAFISMANSVAILLNGIVKLLAIVDGPLLLVLKNLDLILKGIAFGVVTWLIATGLPVLSTLLGLLLVEAAAGVLVINGLTVAVYAFAGAVMAAGGPLVVLVAAIAALGVAVAAYMRASGGLSASEKKRLAQNAALAVQTEKQKDATEKLTKNLSSQAAAAGKLSGNLRIYIDQLDVLDEKQIQVGLSAGTLFETATGAIMSLALAFEMQKEGLDGADAFIEDAKKHSAELKKEWELEEKALSRKLKVLEKIKEKIESSGSWPGDADVYWEAAGEALGTEIKSIDQLNLAIGEYTKKVAQLAGAHATLESGILRGDLLARQRAENALLVKKSQITSNQIKLAEDLRKAEEKSLDLQIKLMQELESLRTRGGTDRMAAINNAYQQAVDVLKAEMDAMKAAGADPASIKAKEEELNRFLKDLELKSRLETINEMIEMQEKASDEVFKLREESEYAIIEREYDLKVEALQKKYDAELLASGKSDELDRARFLTKSEYYDEWQAKKSKLDDKAAQERADAEEKANDILLGLQNKYLKESERLELERDKVLLENSGASAETRLAIEEAYNRQIEEARKDEKLSFKEWLKDKFDATRKFFRKMREAGEKEIGGLFKALASTIGPPIKKILGKIKSALGKIVIFGKLRAKIAAKFAESPFISSAAKIGASVKKVMGGFIGAAGGVIMAIGKIGSTVMSGVSMIANATMSVISKFSGFSFSPAAMAQELAAAKAAADEEGSAFSYAKEARKYVDGLVDQAVGFAEGLASGLGPALEQIAARLPELLNAIIAAIPKVVQAIVDVLPGLIMTIIEKLPELFSALVNGIVDVALALFDALPGMLTQFLSVALPNMITTLLAAIPKIIDGLIKALPGILTAIIDSIPIIIEAFIMGLPDIVIAIIKAVPMIYIEIIKAIPRVVVAIVWGILKALGGVVGQLGKIISQAFLGVFSALDDAFGDFFSKFNQDERENISKARKDSRDELAHEAMTSTGWSRTSAMIKSLFNPLTKEEKAEAAAGGSAYSGISYVPANMRVNVHKGEAIIPASRNAQGDMSGANRAGPGAYGGGGMGQPIDIAIMAEGRLLDAVQITAMRRGHAPEIKSELRRASGVTVGFNRGSFDYWTK